jgi:tripartite ATP-independent transporter DctM subunit
MSIEMLTLLLIVSMFLLFVTGLPIAFGLSAIAIILGFFFWGPPALKLAAQAAYSSYSSWVLVALPLFVLMGFILAQSGIADTMFGMVHRWMGGINGGLAMGSVIVCTIMGAMVGIVGAGVMTMGVVALPPMLERRYDKHLAMGSVMAGGALGTVIPPSVSMIIYASVTKVSVGKMFAGGIIPGVILATLYIIYIGIRGLLNPKVAPALPPEERGTLLEKIVDSRHVILPIILILSVLGSIFAGVATPTEAAAVGCVGAVVCAIVYRKFSWKMLRDALFYTTKLFGLFMWIIIGAMYFSQFYLCMGAGELVKNTVLALDIPPLLVVVLMQFSLIILGALMDDYAVILLAAPLYGPVIVALGFDPIWFGILFILNMQMAVLTPPYGFALFYMKGIRPDMPMIDLYKSVIAFVPLQATGLAIIMVFPQLALWLPGLLFKVGG